MGNPGFGSPWGIHHPIAFITFACRARRIDGEDRMMPVLWRILRERVSIEQREVANMLPHPNLTVALPDKA